MALDANLSCRCGATAWFNGSDMYVRDEVKAWRADHLSCCARLTTAGAIPTADSAASHSDAVRSGMNAYLMDKQPGGVNLFTTHTTPLSSPSGQGDTSSGPAARAYKCAHFKMSWYSLGNTGKMIGWCELCGALKLDGKIRVPGVVEITSTSPSEGSKPSAESSPEESAPSPLSY